MLKVTLVLLSCLSVSFGIDINENDFKHILSRVEELENENKLLKREMHGRHRRIIFPGEPPVSFTAGISSRYVDHLNPNDTIKFGQVVTDIGTGYNNQTGVFTAPISGIYMFSCSLLDHMGRPGDGSGVNLHADMVKENQVLARVYAHAEDKYRDQGAQTIFVQLIEGERVWVRIGDSVDLKMGGEMYSTFSGYLMYPMV